MLEHHNPPTVDVLGRLDDHRCEEGLVVQIASPRFAAGADRRDELASAPADALGEVRA